MKSYFQFTRSIELNQEGKLAQHRTSRSQRLGFSNSESIRRIIGILLYFLAVLFLYVVNGSFNKNAEIFKQIAFPRYKTPNISEDNINATKQFYKIQLKDKGKTPTKLIYRENRYYKSIVITLIKNMSINTIAPFFVSLNCTGYNGELLIFYSNITQEVYHYIESFKLDFSKITMIEIIDKIPYFANESLLKSLKWKCDYSNLEFVLCDERFEEAYCLYKNHFFDDYDFMLITDCRDVLFQTDITQYNYEEGVYIAEEARTYSRKAMFWIEMVNRSFLPKITKEWSDLCVGTLILVGNGFSFLEDLHKEIMILEPHVFQKPNFQGALIILVHNNTFNYKPGFLHFITCEHGIIGTFGRYMLKLVGYRNMDKEHKRNRKLYHIFTCQLHDHNNIFYNSDFQTYSILHHVNRFPEIYELTYPNLKQTCRVSKLNIYDYGIIQNNISI